MKNFIFLGEETFNLNEDRGKDGPPPAQKH